MSTRRARIRQGARGFCCVALDNPKTVANVGSAMRAVSVFGAEFLAVSGARCRYKRASTDTEAAYRRIPLLQVADLREVLPFDCVPVAVELVQGAKLLPEYTHPVRAMYVFGAEDATLGERVLSWCRDVVEIPSRSCLNLAAAVNVVLYDRTAKQQETP